MIKPRFRVPFVAAEVAMGAVESRHLCRQICATDGWFGNTGYVCVCIYTYACANVCVCVYTYIEFSVLDR